MEDGTTKPRDIATDRPTPAGPEVVPLVLDIDGTLLRTDLLYESFWAAMGRSLLATLAALFACWKSPSTLKRRLREIAEPEIELLPVRDPVLELALHAQARGQAVHLASAADQPLVDAVAQRFALPGPHFGSSGAINLKGRTKALALTARFGDGGYDYVGDSTADLAPWASARRAVVVNPGRRLAAELKTLGKPVLVVTDTFPPGSLWREMRPHQWIKNLLLLLPALAAHDLGTQTLGPILIAILAFSIGASAIYIINDLLDLTADRSHPEKRNRPVASGALPIPHAMLASGVLTLAALGLALVVSPGVAALTLAYMTGSLAYSLWLKKRRWLDLLTLAGLFLLRVLTGAMAAQVTVSGWLLGFVFAVFFTLACVKRMTELARAAKRTHMPGRGYSQRDVPRLEIAAYLGAALSAALFAGYALSSPVAQLYATPALLATAALPVAVWLGRIVRLGRLGREDYDPVMFVLRDRIGLGIAATGLAMVLLAI